MWHWPLAGVQMKLPEKIHWALALLVLTGTAVASGGKLGAGAQEIQATEPRSVQQFHDQADKNGSLFESYPTGFYVGLSSSFYYRNMRSDSAWRFVYPGPKKYDTQSWGPVASLELGYQISDHWGLAWQGAWTGSQKVMALSFGSGYSSGDYKRLTTCWTALLLRLRMRMDYRYYFIAEVGPAYIMQNLQTRSMTTTTDLHDNRVLPTAIIGIQYRVTQHLNFGLQYQLLWGQQNWRDTWAGSASRYPAMQMLGIKLSYQFNS